MSLAPGGLWRRLLLVSVAVCAASGLVYELALLSLSTSLNGGGIVETSLIVAGYVAALGLGALCAKPFLRWPAQTFLAVETILGLVGGTSAIILYVTFATIGQSTVLLVVATALIGMLVGAELPLLMTLVQRGRIADARSAGSLLATLNFADYAGALVGGLAWPFVLLPTLGLMRGTLAAGMINLLAALFLGAVLLRHWIPARRFAASITALLVAVAVLAVLLVRSDGIVTTARQSLYADPVIYAHQSDYQDIVVTERGQDRRLFLNGGLQYSTRDEYRYTESLVYPVLHDDARDVLVIGGGDGLAARELLKMDIEVTQVELDPAVIRLANTVLREDNGGALEDPRVNVIVDDAFTWLRAGGEGRAYDAVIIDLPDPNNETMARLYSEEFYTLAHRVLAPGGRMVVQSSSAFTTPDVFWRVNATLEAAGCEDVIPYHVHVPTFGDWGFNLCAPSGTQLRLPAGAPELRYLDDEVLAAAGVFGRDNRPRELEPSTLDRPHIVEDLRRGYRQAGQ
ncbi:polyamine aminopropyltransferase [Corynebacterium halotolerans]|uniref:Polyamine aminopropyltransferase n=1 Tax=Corynebacterium halotolerans YIM 70093 = DSM 44683 TaxID=1121362 RepID=M1P111_9CORY|nr:polyamine aminopropyltransferase [Corynebacterium halotolerans]AGF73460.1 spermidine synthase [Corynebacterium halotolerans YIM 70093 = DSM 44683]